MIGQTIGMLTVLSKHSDGKRSYYECQCICGTTTRVRTDHLSSGNTKSCGCLARTTAIANNKARTGTSNRRFTNDQDRAIAAIYSRTKTSARIRGIPFHLSLDEYTDLVNQNCYYRGEPPSVRYISTRNTRGREYSFVANGVDRFDSTAGYTIENCVPCCWKCNEEKTYQNGWVFLAKCISSSH